jgi:hypothetical protein
MSYSQHFDADLHKIRALGQTYRKIQVLDADLDLSDLLRTQLVMAVSALDRLLHAILADRLTAIYLNTEKPTPEYYEFIVSKIKQFKPKEYKNDPFASLFHQPLQTDGSNFESLVRSELKTESLQNYYKIREKFKLVYSESESSKEGIWNAITDRTKYTVGDIRQRLDTITERRNKIVHESDMSLDTPNERQPIELSELESTLDFIESIGKAFIAHFAAPAQ